MKDFKLTKERFEEIKKMISENPTKVEKSIKKNELLDFISDLLAIKDSKEKEEMEKTVPVEEFEKLMAELTQQNNFLESSNEKVEKLQKEVDDLIQNLDAANTQLNIADECAIRGQKLVRMYQIFSIGVLLALLLTLIFA